MQRVFHIVTQQLLQSWTLFVKEGNVVVLFIFRTFDFVFVIITSQIDFLSRHHPDNFARWNILTKIFGCCSALIPIFLLENCIFAGKTINNVLECIKLCVRLPHPVVKAFLAEAATWSNEALLTYYLIAIN